MFLYAFSIAIPSFKEGIAIEKAYKNINIKCIQEHMININFFLREENLVRPKSYQPYRFLRHVAIRRYTIFFRDLAPY